MIQLKHIQPADINYITSYVTDPKVTEFLTRDAYSNIEDIEKFVNYSVSCKNYPNEFLGVWYNDVCIGTVHILMENWKYIKIGFGIVPTYRHQGLGTKIVRSILQYIPSSSRKNVSQQVVAEVHKNNKAAIRILDKNDFSFLAISDSHDREKYLFTYQ